MAALPAEKQVKELSKPVSMAYKVITNKLEPHQWMKNISRFKMERTISHDRWMKLDHQTGTLSYKQPSSDALFMPNRLVRLNVHIKRKTRS